MSLRIRLFLILSALVALMVLAQWWWVRALTRDLSGELGDVAFSVSHSVASVILEDRKPICQGADCEALNGEVNSDEVNADETGEAGEEAKDDEPRQARRVRKQVWVHPEVAREADVYAFFVPDEGAGHATSHSTTIAPGTEVHWETEFHTLDDHPAAELESAVIAQPHRSRFLLRLNREEDVPVLAVEGPNALHHIPIPRRGLESQLESLQQRLLLGALGLLGVGLLLAALVAHRVSAPLRQLAIAARQLGDGALGTQVAVRADGEAGEAIAAFNHMSERLATLDARARDLDARQHLGEIGEIGRGLAHTLRNPLNALGLSVEEIAARVPTAAEGGLIDAARRQIRRIDHAVRSFLALASQGSAAAENVDVLALAQDVVLEALQDSRGRVRIAVEGGENLQPLYAVPPELRAVLQALVVNAVEASPDGAAVTVRLGTAMDDQGVLVEVEDRGPGLPPAVRERLFTPHLTTKANGSGMGLFLAHRISTTRYGGSLVLAARSGGGTRAALTLAPRRNETGNEADHG